VLDFGFRRNDDSKGTFDFKGHSGESRNLGLTNCCIGICFFWSGEAALHKIATCLSEGRSNFDKVVKSLFFDFPVIPAKAGIQYFQ
jgi:hypothetical protein